MVEVLNRTRGPTGFGAVTSTTFAIATWAGGKDDLENASIIESLHVLKPWQSPILQGSHNKVSWSFCMLIKIWCLIPW